MDIGVYIRLSKGYVAIVDREDTSLADFCWSACYRRSKNGKVRIYAVRQWRVSGTIIRQFLHQAIYGEAVGDIDHADGDTLNCRRYNLRDASRSMNNANATKRVGTTSRFKGVHFHSPAKKWNCQVKKKNYGLYAEETDAGQAYNFVADLEYGEFARFNEA